MPQMVELKRKVMLRCTKYGAKDYQNAAKIAYPAVIERSLIDDLLLALSIPILI